MSPAAVGARQERNFFLALAIVSFLVALIAVPVALSGGIEQMLIAVVWFVGWERLSHHWLGHANACERISKLYDRAQK